MPVYNRFYRAVVQQNPAGQPFPRGLQATGPFLPVQIEVPLALATQLQQAGQAPPPAVAGFALLDTGASVSAVDAAIMQQLSVQPVGLVTVGTAGGPQQQALFPARFTFPGTNIPGINFNRLLGSNLQNQQIPGHGPIVALLGRDLMTRFILIYNGPGACFSIAF